MKKHFLQPLDGKRNFPSYYNSVKKRKTFESYRASHDAFPQERFEEGALHYGVKSLRGSDPALHRALLDRIKQKKIEILHLDGEWVRADDLETLDQERIANAEKRQPRNHSDPRKRAEWVKKLRAQGLDRSSAQRKLKRWMNTANLSANEIELSITKGRLVRLDRHA